MCDDGLFELVGEWLGIEKGVFDEIGWLCLEVFMSELLLFCFWSCIDFFVCL